VSTIRENLGEIGLAPAAVDNRFARGIIGFEIEESFSE
jgi:hypothetical protein